MTKADTIFKENITKIMEEGVWSEQARPKYKDGTTANSKYITGSFAEYDLSKGEFPITTLRPIAIKSAIKEVFWIYQDQSNSLDVLEDKYNVHYWNDNPEHLGKIYLEITSKDGTVSAHLTAQNEVVKEALESQIADLKQNMNQAGVKVDAVEVTVGGHEFEKNLEQNAKQEEQQAEEREKAANATRHINLNELDGLSGLMTEEETLVAKMMAEQGNSVDFTA